MVVRSTVLYILNLHSVLYQLHLNFLEIKKKITYLAAPGLSCHMWGLRLWHADSSLQPCGIQFPNQELNLGPLHWEHGPPATGPPGKSPNFFKKAKKKKKNL